MTPHLSACSSVGTGRVTVRRSALSCAVELLLVLALQSASAATTQYVYYQGRPIFEYEILAHGEAAFDFPDLYAEGAPDQAQRDLTAEELDGLQLSGALWAEILGPGAVNSAPVKVQVVGLDQDYANAAAASFPNLDASGQPEYLPGPLAQITHNDSAQFPLSVLVGAGLDFIYPQSWQPLPDGSGFDYLATIFHELGHGLGIGFIADYELNFNDFLYDMRGIRYEHGMDLTYFDPQKDDPSDFDTTAFLVGEYEQSGVYFNGPHVSEVLAGSGLAGIPVNGMEFDENGDLFAELSHFELERSMMSHQNYRNYTFFMEAELAAMQDLGYAIDRKNFYGRSLYADNQTIINHQGFYARSTDGSTYLPGTVNTATLGTGLHIYGSDNAVTQAADLLAGGAGGTGIRVDGDRNAVTIRNNVQIRADGPNGTGVLFAYGQNHSLNADGTVTALGDNGIALRFDFGGNLLGDATERRGSYILYAEDEDLLDQLDPDEWLPPSTQYDHNTNLNNGPLLDQVNITGTLAGTQAALYISDNALVQEINVLPGAQIYGNLVSHWDPNSPYINAAAKDPDYGIDLTTALNFGVTPSARSNARTSDRTTARANTRANSSARHQDFDLTLYGSIDGPDSFDLTLLGGKLTVLGYTKTLSLSNEGELTLLGQDDAGYTLTTQTMNLAEDSVLRLPHGAKAKVGTAHLAGSLAIPLPATYYYNGAPVAATVSMEGTISSTFDQAQFELPPSPTLAVTPAQLHTRNDQGVLHFQTTAEISRSPEAYAQYADSAATASTGRTLVHLAKHNSPYAQLLQELDFSEPSGHAITRALHTLSAESYLAAAQAALHQLQAEDSLLQFQQWAEPITASEGSQIYGKLLYSAYDSNEAHWDSDGFSALIGADTKLTPNWSVGVNLSLSTLRTDIEGNHEATAEAQSILAGVRALYRPAATGFYWQGSARAGMQDGDMERSLSVGSYHAQMDSEWQAFSATVQTAAGYDLLWAGEHHNLRTGPFIGAHYGLIRTPDINESGAAALNLDSHSYERLPLELGWRLQWDLATEAGHTIKLAADAAFFYDLMNDHDHCAATWSAASAPSFDSELERDGRSGAYLNLGAELQLTSGFDLGLTCGALTGADLDGLNLALDLNYRF